MSNTSSFLGSAKAIRVHGSDHNWIVLPPEDVRTLTMGNKYLTNGNILRLPSPSSLAIGEEVHITSATNTFLILCDDTVIVRGNLPLNLGETVNPTFEFGATISCIKCSRDGQVIILGIDTMGLSISFDAGQTFDWSTAEFSQSDQRFPVENVADIGMNDAGSVAVVLLSFLHGVSSHVLVASITREHDTVTWRNIELFDQGSEQWSCVDVSPSGNNIVIASRSGVIYHSTDLGVSWVQVESLGIHPWVDVSVNEAGWMVLASSDGTAVISNLVNEEDDPPTISLPRLESWTSCWMGTFSSEGGPVDVILATYDYVYIYTTGSWIRLTPGVTGIHTVGFLPNESFGTFIVAGYNGLAVGTFSFGDLTAWTHLETSTTCVDMDSYIVNDTPYYFFLGSSQFGSIFRKGALMLDQSPPGTSIFGYTRDSVTLVYVGDDTFACTSSAGRPFLGEEYRPEIIPV